MYYIHVHCIEIHICSSFGYDTYAVDMLASRSLLFLASYSVSSQLCAKANYGRRCVRQM